MASLKSTVLDALRQAVPTGASTIGLEQLKELLASLNADKWSSARVDELLQNIGLDKVGDIDIEAFVNRVFQEDALGAPEANRVRSATHPDMPDSLPYASFAKELRSLQLEDLERYKDFLDKLADKYRSHWSQGLRSESFFEEAFMRSQLKDCIFVGHVNTDLDSVAGAICAAELFGGIAARAEEGFNGEIECALRIVNMEPPPTFASLEAKGFKDRNVCLVDHNEADQMTPTLRDDPKRSRRIRGLIDHHAVAPSFNTSGPLFIDVRPRGSMCTIVFHIFLRTRVPIRKEIARLLLCAILSDTLNLKSGTTTPADRFSVALLSSFSEVEDVNALAMQLFEAKTHWIVGLGAYEMVRGDQKNFIVGDLHLSLAVLEVTTLEPVLAVAEDVLTQLRVFKYEKGDVYDVETGETRHDVKKECHCALLFVVDTLQQKSVALICGGREKFVAQAAFPEASWRSAAADVRAPSDNVTAEETLCNLGGLVSRKLDFMPRCTQILAAGVPEWFKSPSPNQERLGKVLNSKKLQPLMHDSVKVVWDKVLLKAAVFETRADAALLMDILQEDYGED